MRGAMKKANYLARVGDRQPSRQSLVHILRSQKEEAGCHVAGTCITALERFQNACLTCHCLANQIAHCVLDLRMPSFWPWTRDGC